MKLERNRSHQQTFVIDFIFTLKIMEGIWVWNVLGSKFLFRNFYCLDNDDNFGKSSRVRILSTYSLKALVNLFKVFLANPYGGNYLLRINVNIEFSSRFFSC